MRFKKGSIVYMRDYGMNTKYIVTVIKKQGSEVLVTHPSGKGTLLVDEKDLISEEEFEDEKRFNRTLDEVDTHY